MLGLCHVNIVDATTAKDTALDCPKDTPSRVAQTDTTLCLTQDTLTGGCIHCLGEEREVMPSLRD
jgi:hypothetical protein